MKRYANSIWPTMSSEMETENGTECYPVALYGQTIEILNKLSIQFTNGMYSPRRIYAEFGAHCKM